MIFVVHKCTACYSDAKLHQKETKMNITFTKKEAAKKVVETAIRDSIKYGLTADEVVALILKIASQVMNDSCSGESK